MSSGGKRCSPRWSAWLGCAVWLGTTSVGASPRVVASIVPIHSLVAGVMQGVGEPALVVKGFGSPHVYQMRPSDAANLGRADLVFWIGDAMETFLRRPIAGLSDDTRVVALGSLEDLALLPNRHGGVWEPEPDSPAARQRDEPGHGHDGPEHLTGGHDAHTWLDARNASVMVRAIVVELSAADAANAEVYRANGERVMARLEALDRELADRLGMVRDVPFVVFHDAFQYLERRYGLHGVGSVTVGPERMPSAKRIRELRRHLEEMGVVCVFREPQFESALVETVVEGSDVRIGIIDPLGSSLTPGPDAYFELMRSNGQAIVDCLGG